MVREVDRSVGQLARLAADWEGRSWAIDKLKAEVELEVQYWSKLMTETDRRSDHEADKTGKRVDERNNKRDAYLPSRRWPAERGEAWFWNETKRPTHGTDDMASGACICDGFKFPGEQAEARRG